jgi:PD-(D/E)XK nuclease superfamily
MFTHNFVTPPVMSVDESDGSRMYVTPNGDKYESVTRFINRLWNKDFLEKWKKRIGEARARSESRHATDRGQALHKTTEAYLMNDELEYRKELNAHIPNKILFLKIKPALNRCSNIRLLEKSLYSDALKLAGTPDIIADFDGKLSTIDLKTSGKDKKEEWITTYWLQTAIYTRMFEERYGVLPEQSVIIMAVEDNPMPAVFIESTFTGQMRLQSFINDPIKFQEQLEAEKKAAKKALK